ncbi:30S ribosomal protein S11, chloroplastic [Desmophyllum pertusum]|uniref:30S ribosomal protein S11, chloroplastic n=1 Tax=Desmophyllum pertusum TaxID=174260 RepID=A0A9X0CE55_9CNID|nr:30S ribosomal protein S11, chloroplastic [Desmophyllum pertusum]
MSKAHLHRLATLPHDHDPYQFQVLNIHVTHFLIYLQTERAYQKQAPIFQNKKRILVQTGKKKKELKELRYVRNVGLGFKTPKEAIEGTYIDKKCPFTGNVSIRGRILTGIVCKHENEAHNCHQARLSASHQEIQQI